MKYLLLIPIFVLLVSCGQDRKKSSERLQDPSKLYASESVVVNVVYEEGAEPYTENAAETVLNLKLWDILQSNLEALFDGRTIKPKVIVPKSLPEMTKIVSSKKAEWSIDDILDLDRQYYLSSSSGTTNFRIYFVNGVAKESSSIIGFHISGTNVMAIFKDVIRTTTATQSDLVAKYMEQATIVHELGHAFGLVNNGLPMTTAHQDSDHGAHCSNTNCVMYYTNEGTANLVNYISNNILKNYNPVMFDQQCLNDAKAFK